MFQEMLAAGSGGGSIDISDIVNVQMSTLSVGSARSCYYTVGINSLKINGNNTGLEIYDAASGGTQIGNTSVNQELTLDVSQYNAIWVVAKKNGWYTNDMTVLS